MCGHRGQQFGHQNPDDLRRTRQARATAGRKDGDNGIRADGQTPGRRRSPRFALLIPPHHRTPKFSHGRSRAVPASPSSELAVPVSRLKPALAGSGAHEDRRIVTPVSARRAGRRDHLQPREPAIARTRIDDTPAGARPSETVALAIVEKARKRRTRHRAPGRGRLARAARSFGAARRGRRAEKAFARLREWTAATIYSWLRLCLKQP
jgi:hypothetical protein